MHFPTLNNIFALALVAAPLVAAHGKISVATGDLGGNGTALGSKYSAVYISTKHFLIEIHSQGRYYSRCRTK
jgi:hypothetical protein